MEEDGDQWCRSGTQAVMDVWSALTKSLVITSPFFSTLEDKTVTKRISSETFIPHLYRWGSWVTSTLLVNSRTDNFRYEQFRSLVATLTCGQI